MDKTSLMIGAGAGLAVGGAFAYFGGCPAFVKPNNQAHSKVTVAAEDVDFTEGTGQKRYVEGKAVIAGGVGLLSKRPENHLPGQWPAYYNKCGPGPYVEDLDGNRYMECAYGTCYSVLGFNDPDVDAAVHKAIDAGIMCTLNVPEEVELAEKLIELHPWAKGGSVRYARGGGEVNTIASRLARAATGRDKIAFCGYHGWGDFYIAANVTKTGSQTDGIGAHQIAGLKPAGVPNGLGGTMLPWIYNDIAGLEKIFKENKGEIAMVMMEPMRTEYPVKGFFKRVRELCDEHGALLHIDEVSGGFRENIGGRHLLLMEDGVEPDMATFAKALSNGYAMAALVGKPKVMSAIHDSFISSSYWTEKIGPAAALATIKKMEQIPVYDHCRDMGNKVRAVWNDTGKKHGLKVEASPLVTWPSFGMLYDAETGRTLRSLWKQEMLKLGILAGCQFMMMWTFKDHHLAEYAAAVDTTFQKLSEWLKEAGYTDALKGDELKAVNTKLLEHLKGGVDGLEALGFQRVCK